MDTACSSSLVALHLAMRALRAGEGPRALVGGANVLLDEAVTRSLQLHGALSPRGRCATFDAAADGYFRAEGAAVVVLSPLADPGGPPAYGTVCGTAVNSDGRSNGFTAPRGTSQPGL